jgi:hypothetical protein
MTPASVSRVTHCADIFSTDAPSKGSVAFVAVSGGRALFFFGEEVAASLLFGVGFVTCPAAAQAKQIINTAQTPRRRDEKYKTENKLLTANRQLLTFL